MAFRKSTPTSSPSSGEVPSSSEFPEPVIDQRWRRAEDASVARDANCASDPAKNSLAGSCSRVAALVQQCLDGESTLAEHCELTRNDNLIFVIDDLPPMLGAIERILRSLKGKEVNTFEGVQDALREITRTGELPSIILTDYEMPVVSGLEICKAVNSIRESIRPLVIVMTGVDIKDVGEIFFKAGAFNVLQKPFMRDQILSAVASALSHQERITGLEKNLRIGNNILI